MMKTEREICRFPCSRHKSKMFLVEICPAISSVWLLFSLTISLDLCRALSRNFATFAGKTGMKFSVLDKILRSDRLC